MCSHVCAHRSTHTYAHMCIFLPDNHLQREQLETSVLSMSTFSRTIARWHLRCFGGRALQQLKALCPPPSCHLPRSDGQRPGWSLQTRNQARTRQDRRTRTPQQWTHEVTSLFGRPQYLRDHHLHSDNVSSLKPRRGHLS